MFLLFVRKKSCSEVIVPKMKRKRGLVLLISFFCLFCFSFVNAKDLSVSPFGINIEYWIGDSQPSTILFTFINHDETTFEVDVSKEGDAASFFTLSKTSMSFINNSASSLDASFNIPISTEEGLYTGKILYGDEELPVYIFVDSNETIEELTEGCRILSTYSEHVKSKKKGTPSSTEEYYFKISSDCIDGIDVTDIRLDGAIETEEGLQPLRLHGGIPKGSYKASESFIVTLELDVSELSPQTYTEKLLIAGLTGDDSIRKEIKFTVNVFGSKSTFSDISVIEPPIFDSIPDNLVTNKTYAIIARQVNPNLEIRFEANEFIKGEAPSFEDEVWIYKFQPIKEGETIFKIFAEYKGGVVGTPIIKEIKIRSEVGAGLGTILEIQFFQNLDALAGGDTVSWLVKDNDTEIILPEDMYQVYVNGVKNSGNSLVAEEGKTYTISIASTRYESLEQKFTVQQRVISMSLSPETPSFNDTVTVNTEENATIKLDGTTLEGTTFLAGLGEHVLEASKEGFQSNSLNFTVTLPVQLVNFPLVTEGEPLSIDQELHYGFNQPTYWAFMYMPEDAEEGSPPVMLREGEEQNFIIIPEEEGGDEGDYFLKVTGGQVWASHIEGGFHIFEYWWLKYGVIAVILGLITYARRDWFANKFKKKPKSSATPYEFNP